jgi:hypothetical protein
MSSSPIVQTDRYAYRSLDPTREQVRLILLFESQLTSLVSDASSSESLIHLVMVIFGIEDAPPYTALSYVWARPAPVHDGFIKGQSCKIRKNLFHFFKQICSLRVDEDDSADQWLWVDQLSIDQTNISERSQQAQMMGMIYRRADCVLV